MQPEITEKLQQRYPANDLLLDLGERKIYALRPNALLDAEDSGSGVETLSYQLDAKSYIDLCEAIERFAAGKSEDCELVLREDQSELLGREKPRQFIVRCRRHDEEQRSAVLFDLFDVTRGEEARKELSAAYALRQAEKEAKQTLVTELGHQVRTLLYAIAGTTEYVLETALSAEQRQALRVVAGTAETFLSYMEDFLDLMRLESGELALAPTPVSTRNFLWDIASELSAESKKRHGRFECEISSDVPELLLIDYERVKQILRTLALHSLSYIEDGQLLQLAIGYRQGTAGQAVLTFVLRDNFSRQYQERHTMVLEAFTNADAPMVRRVGGAGLGIALASRLVDLMGGKLWVEAGTRQGFAFHFDLEAQPNEREEAPVGNGSGAEQERDAEKIVSDQFGQLKVLVVDDIELNRQLLSSILRRAGHLVSEASSAREALELLRERRFDVGLIDLQMPEIDGFTLAAIYRKQEQERFEKQRLPLIAVTALAGREVPAKCRAVGIDSVLVKPIGKGKLFLSILETLREEVARRDPNRESASP